MAETNNTILTPELRRDLEIFQKKLEYAHSQVEMIHSQPDYQSLPEEGV